MPWSYSHLSAFEQCPRKHRHTYVLKDVPYVETEERKWGNQVDAALAARARGVQLPPTMKPYEYIGTFLDGVVAAKAQVLPKFKFGVTKELTPTTFFAKDVWYRGEMDLAVIGSKKAWLRDYKTGKPRNDGTQLALYAGVGFNFWLNVEVIDASFDWLLTKRLSTETYTRASRHLIWADLMPRIVKMERATLDGGDDTPIPSPLCAWCPVHSCEHWRVK